MFSHYWQYSVSTIELYEITDLNFCMTSAAQARYCVFRIHRGNTSVMLFLNAHRQLPLIVSIILRTFVDIGADMKDELIFIRRFFISSNEDFVFWRYW